MTQNTLRDRLDALLFKSLVDAETGGRLCGLLATRGDDEPHLDDEALAAVLEGAPSMPSLAHAVSCADCQRELLAVEDAVAITPLPRRVSPARLVGATPRAMFVRVRAGRGTPEVLWGSGQLRASPALPMRRAGAASSGLTMRDRADAPCWQLTLSAVDDGARWSVEALWLGADGVDTVRLTQSQRLIAELPTDRDRATLPRLRPADTRIEFLRDGVVVGVTWISVEAA